MVEAQFETEAAALAFIALINARLGLPDGKGTDTYAAAMQGSDGMWYVGTDYRAEPHLEGVTLASMPVSDEN